MRKATISFIMSVCPSARVEQLGPYSTKFNKIWYLSSFRKSVEKIHVSLKSDKQQRALHMNNNINFWTYLAQFFLERENFRIKFVENITFYFQWLLFRKSCRSWDNVGKYCRPGEATDDNLAHAHCMLNTYDYRHTLRICNTYCFFSATMVTRTRLNITLYVRCRPYLDYKTAICKRAKTSSSFRFEDDI